MTGEPADDSTDEHFQPKSDGATHSHGSTTAKVIGEVAASGDIGVVGHNTAASGDAVGVEGVTDSASSGAIGVRGHATASGTLAGTTGVEGVSDADADFASGIFPVGVSGRVTGTGGTTAVSGLNENDPDGVGTFGRGIQGDGVLGRTDSTAKGAAGTRGRAHTEGTAAETFGVKGISRADGDVSSTPAFKTAGVYGTATGASVTHGVFGEARNEHSLGVVGTNLSGDYANVEGLPGGVYGVTDRSGADSGVEIAAGVGGGTTAASGASYGVNGFTQNPDGAGVRGVDQTGEAYGLLTPDDARVEGDHQVGGNLEMNAGAVYQQRSDPDTSELDDGQVMTFNADGSGTGSAGDLVYAVNDGGTIKTTVIAQASNATT